MEWKPRNHHSRHLHLGRGDKRKVTLSLVQTPHHLVPYQPVVLSPQVILNTVNQGTVNGTEVDISDLLLAEVGEQGSTADRHGLPSVLPNESAVPQLAWFIPRCHCSLTPTVLPAVAGHGLMLSSLPRRSDLSAVPVSD